MRLREAPLPAVRAARHLGGLRLRLRFRDGLEGTLGLAALRPLRGLLRALEDPAYVAQVRVSRVEGAITRPNGVALDPVVLHGRVRGVPLPTYANASDGRPHVAPTPAPARRPRRTRTRS
jgi:hypothetical protein